MSVIQNHFTDLVALKTHIHTVGKGSLMVAYRNMDDYDGMVLGIAIIFDAPKGKYELDLQWISFGLDLYGENLLENYLYQFDSLENLLDYLHTKYAMAITDIPVKYNIDPDAYPNPFKDEAKNPLFEAAWQRFQQDFKAGDFLDRSLNLVYSSDDW
ncbi:MAG: hypothetical protein R3D00_13630 [Bacteroidia bacterium]